MPRIKGHILSIVILASALATCGCSSAGLGIAAAGVAVKTVSALASAAREDARTTTVAEATRAIERSDNQACKNAVDKARAAAVPEDAAAGVRANVPAITPPPEARGRMCRVRLVCVTGRTEPVAMRLCRTEERSSGDLEPGFRLPQSPSAPSEGPWSWGARGDATHPPSVGNLGG